MVILHEAWESYELELSTDRRKRMIFRPSVDFTHGEIRGWGREYKLSTTVRPTDYINMTLSVSNEYKPSFMQWVDFLSFCENHGVLDDYFAFWFPERIKTFGMCLLCVRSCFFSVCVISPDRNVANPHHIRC